ncbi:MAG: PhzF family phenazine biosynthesis protein, partial [Bacteroidota bacterium]
MSDASMQALARELNLSETVYLFPSGSKKSDLRIRWFTPAVEVPLCGHATIAAFHVLAEEGSHGMKQPGVYEFRVHTKSGTLDVVVDKKYSGAIVEFQLPVPRFRRLKSVPVRLLAALGLSPSDLRKDLPVVVQNYAYVPVRRLPRILSLAPDFQALREVSRTMKILGVSVFTTETVEESSAFHSRFFAPAAGIDEDPVTGSANGPLGAYLFSYALPAGTTLPSLWLPDERLELIGEQGDAIGRKGRVKVRLKVGTKSVKKVSIAGEAVTVFRSEVAV